MSAVDTRSLLLIDDDGDLLAKLQAALEEELSDEAVEIRIWKPDHDDNPVDVFAKLVDPETVLVVTDYDLTRNGLTGLFGASIVSWCQSRLLPVGDFSRGNIVSLPCRVSHSHPEPPLGDPTATQPWRALR
jgi:hypothetical protein